MVKIFYFGLFLAHVLTAKFSRKHVLACFFPHTIPCVKISLSWIRVASDRSGLGLWRAQRKGADRSMSAAHSDLCASHDHISVTSKHIHVLVLPDVSEPWWDSPPH